MKKVHHFHCHAFFHKGKVVWIEPVCFGQGWTSWETLITTPWNHASQIFSKINGLGVLFGLGAVGQTQTLREPKAPAWGLKSLSDIPERILSLHVQLTVLWLQKIRRVKGEQGRDGCQAFPTYWSTGCGERTKVFQRRFWCLQWPWCPCRFLGRELDGGKEHWSSEFISCSLLVFSIYIFNN